MHANRLSRAVDFGSVYNPISPPLYINLTYTPLDTVAFDKLIDACYLKNEREKCETMRNENPRARRVASSEIESKS